jgi:hypothetical protein
MLLLEDSPQALIEEARARTRRRRRRGGLALALLIAIGAVVGLMVRAGGSGVVSESASTPFANLAAFAGQGELAFVSRNAVWALDGGAQTLRRLPVPAGWTPSSPKLSHDGRWLAYTAREFTDRDPSPVQLWLARGDGTGAHLVRGLDFNGLVGWSPTADLLAVIAGEYGSAFELVYPGGRMRTLVEIKNRRLPLGSVSSAAWSPDGRQIAISTEEFGGANDGATIRAYPVAGGVPSTWYRIGNDQRFPDHICSHCGGAREVSAELVGWWPRWGMGFWVYCCGATRELDGSSLALIGHPGAQPRVLTRTLSDGVTDAIAVGSRGALAVVADNPDPGREIGAGKTVEICAAGQERCEAVPGATTWSGPDRQRCVIPTQSATRCLGVATAPAGQPGSGVSLDPSWSPGAELLAYVRAPIALTQGWPDAAWYAAHDLYIFNPHTGTTRRIGNVDGANVPTWSAGGHDLLYVRDDGLWLAPADGGAPTEIVYPLFRPVGLYSGFSHDYYGQIPWTAQFNWWSPGR